MKIFRFLILIIFFSVIFSFDVLAVKGGSPGGSGSTTPVDNTPDNGGTDAAGEDWAFDHENGADPHPGYVLESAIGTTVPAIATTVQFVTQSVTTDADPYTLTPTTGYENVRILLTTHADNVDLLLSETGASDMEIIRIVNLSTNTAILDDSAGVQVINGYIELEQYDSVTLQYQTNQWVLLSANVTNPYYNSVSLPYSDDPDLIIDGGISVDSDGWVRVRQNSIQKAIPLTQPLVFSPYKPQDMDDAQRDHYWIYVNTTGMSLVITKWTAKSTSDDTTATLYEEDGDGQNDTTIDAVEVATNGTGLFYATDSTITAATIEDGHIIYIDFDDTDAPAQYIIVIDGYWLADVN